MTHHTIKDVSAIVLFGGPGGVCTGLRAAGVTDLVSVENDEAAVLTAEANGHRTIFHDVTTLTPSEVVRDYLSGLRLLLQSSPPCQGLSTAGKGKGREDVEKLIEMIRTLPGLLASRLRIPAIMDELWKTAADPRSPLTFETLRWIAELVPHHVVMEQVPSALPIWEAYAVVLRRWGYNVWTGMVYSEQYGVPQTRKRAILMASLDLDVAAPVPTHSKFHNRSPEKLDQGVEKWVSMAEALAPLWGLNDLVGFPRKYDGRGEVVVLDGQEYRGRDLRPAELPAQTVTEKARSWNRYPEAYCSAGRTGEGRPRPVEHPAPTITAAGNGYFMEKGENWEPAAMGDVRSSKGTIREVDQPAATITASADNGNYQWIDRDALVAKMEERLNNQSGTEFDLTWPADRPAPTIAGREIVTMPGANANRYNGSTKSRNDGVRVTPQEAAILQSFPADYQWEGSKTKQYEQIGNAVPPMMMTALATGLLAALASEMKEDAA